MQMEHESFNHKELKPEVMIVDDQEMNREMNTIGSKASDEAISKMVISGKNDIEKLREQVQNVE